MEDEDCSKEASVYKGERMGPSRMDWRTSMMFAVGMVERICSEFSFVKRMERGRGRVIPFTTCVQWRRTLFGCWIVSSETRPTALLAQETSETLREVRDGG